MQAAYAALPDARQAELATLRVVHSWARSREKSGSRRATAQELLDAPPVVHPLIRTHPMTGSKGLYLGNHSSHVEGWSTEKGEALLQELQDFATQDRFVYRHHWRPDDMLIWDNCALLHRALANYDMEAQIRVLNRTVVRGAVPI